MDCPGAADPCLPGVLVKAQRPAVCGPAPYAPDVSTIDLPAATGHRLSLGGSLGAVAGFAVSLPPSLLPRESVMQGVLSGILVAIGYRLGRLIVRGTRRLGGGLAPAWAPLGLLGPLGLLAAANACRWLGWQNAQRLEMGMTPLSLQAWVPTLLITALVAGLLTLLHRGLCAVASRCANPVLSGVAFAAAAALVVAGTGVAIVVATSAFAHSRDRGTTQGTVQPASALRSGSPSSLVDWAELGRKGRDFVAFGPTVAELTAANSTQALEPIRVYIGRDAAESVQARAALAVAELRRTGAFDRKVLVLAVPTGTGLVEPFSADAVEYLHNGDTAIAAVAYSDLPSWLSIAMDRQKVRQTATALFDAVYPVWQALPADRRPQLYLYGHSLGAYGLQPVLAAAAQLPQPIDGALLAGPPFMGALAPPEVPWARYLQHPSDPVVLVSASLAWQRPGWLGGDRPPDLPAQMRWLPLVTWLQVAADLPQAVFVPWGYGHMYSERDYLLGWAEASTSASAQRIDALVEQMRNDSSPVSYMLN